MQTTIETISSVLNEIVEAYPEGMRALEHEQVQSIAWRLKVVADRIPAGGSVVDVGGGVGMMSIGAAALGYRSILIDDFGEAADQTRSIDSMGVHQRYGVSVISTDATQLDDGLFAPESLDAVTSFDSIEHWHSSPKPTLHKLMTALKPGGLFFLGVPNCVDLRKRLTVPLGKGKWSALTDWYDEPVFRGHIREMDVEDLEHIARDLGLASPAILGRNWQGYTSRSRLIRLATPILDRLIQVAPSLCADLYLIGTKAVG